MKGFRLSEINRGGDSPRFEPGAAPRTPPHLTMQADPEFTTALIALRPSLYSHAWRLTWSKPAAEDLVQSALVAALSHHHSFERGSNLGAWVHRILRNEFINGVRGIRGRPTSALEDVPESLTVALPAQEPVCELKETLRAIGRMPPHMAQVLLGIADGLTYDEIAEAAQTSVGTIKSRAWRARKELQEALNDPRPHKAEQDQGPAAAGVVVSDQEAARLAGARYAGNTGTERPRSSRIPSGPRCKGLTVDGLFLKISPQQARIFMALYHATLPLTHQTLWRVIYDRPMPDDAPHWKIPMAVSGLRRKLSGTPFKIARGSRLGTYRLVRL